jgi:hypothetical protein
LAIWHPNREKRFYGETVPKKDKAPDKGGVARTLFDFQSFYKRSFPPSWHLAVLSVPKKGPD